MKQKDNYGLEKGDIERGFTEGEYENKAVKESQYEIADKPEVKGKTLDDSPTNSRWDDLDDGGFLGRAKGQER